MCTVTVMRNLQTTPLPPTPTAHCLPHTPPAAPSPSPPAVRARAAAGGGAGPAAGFLRRHSTRPSAQPLLIRHRWGLAAGAPQLCKGAHLESRAAGKNGSWHGPDPYLPSPRPPEQLCLLPANEPTRSPACALRPAATVDDSLPFILNILLANCASLAGVAVVLCITQVRQASA